MADMTILFFAKNTITVSFIFWVLTLVGTKFFKKEENIHRHDFYECGFKTTQDLNLKLNFSFFYMSIFVVLYDVELVFLVPFLFNVTLFNTTSLVVVILFLLAIFYTFVIDILTKVIEWNYRYL